MLIRLTEVLREIVRGGLAGVIAGTLVGGLGGRFVMSVAALINPDATGLLTENGALIGAFTAKGTLALMFFGGLGGGAVGGIAWVVLSPWMPGSGRRRWILAMPLAVLTLGSFLVQSGNPDFTVLGADVVIVALLLGLVALTGAAVAWLDVRLERRLPRPGTQPMPHVLVYGVAAAIGALIVPLAMGLFTSRQTCGCANPPIFVGWALIAVGIATLAAWMNRIVFGRPAPPRLLVVGRVALAAVVVLGGAQLIPEIVKILSRS